ncbi:MULTISPECIES: hypothetical protein [Streptococcus]|uniref:Uncharacterized protein n=1 Tax=Streptococcus porcorum TaxID=701526 RepID=A0ABV2JK26_9STRE|nr:hypothetical protein [Streptococcus sp.]MDY3823714.1 hypothetical protein [Streptococcus sp.]
MLEIALVLFGLPSGIVKNISLVFREMFFILLDFRKWYSYAQSGIS